MATATRISMSTGDYNNALDALDELNKATQMYVQSSTNKLVDNFMNGKLYFWTAPLAGWTVISVCHCGYDHRQLHAINPA